MTTESNAAAGTRGALISRTQLAWGDLLSTVDGLDDGRLAAPGPEGWSIKDHLAHVTRWEAYLLAVLDGGDGRAELGLAGGERPEVDDINGMLQRQDAGCSIEEVRRRLAETHARLAARLESLDAAALERHMGLIRGNTHEHYAEHAGWIRSLAAAAGPPTAGRS